MIDLTVVATPMYFGSMGVEARALKKRAAAVGTSAADYERRDTIANLAMGTGSLVLPIYLRRLVKQTRPRRGKLGRAVLATAITAAAVTTVADVIGRRSETALDPDRNTERTETRATRRERQKVARRAAAIGGVTTVASVFASAAAVWGTATTTDALFKRRLTKDLGAGVIPLALAIVGWDFVYYWNHRFMHESRFMWAIHVVHHSSERYNLSVALRQPWADPLGVFVPYFVALFGVRPDLLETARGVNLLYQYWIHTDLVDRLGPFEKVLNTPSHHRVHHGMNPEYIDKNYGSILIIWDRLFGSFKIEADPVVYGLTKNIDSFNPATIAAHEYVEIGRDVARSTSWRERLAFTVRGPGWALTHRRAHASEARRISRAQALAPQR